jgi:dTDP-glucose pyrophosphorylase
MVVENIRRLKPSGRARNHGRKQFYIDEDKLTYGILDGWWMDAGTFDSSLHTNALVAKTGANKMNRPAISARQENTR